MPEHCCTLSEKVDRALTDAHAARMVFSWSHTLTAFCTVLTARATAPGAEVWWQSQPLRERGIPYTMVELCARTRKQYTVMQIMRYYPGDRLCVRVASGAEIPGAEASVLGREATLPACADSGVVEDALASLVRAPEFHSQFGFLGLRVPPSPTSAT